MRLLAPLHASAKIDVSFVERWIIDDRISVDIQWTPVLPGKRVDWKQQQPIESIFAASSTRRLHDWVGTSSDAVNKGGRPRKEPAPAARRDGCAAADAGGAAAAALQSQGGIYFVSQACITFSRQKEHFPQTPLFFLT